MQRFINMLLLSCCLSAGYAGAESGDTSKNAVNSDSPTSVPDQASMEAALTACASSAGKDSSGYADQSAKERCMMGKRFSRPSAVAGKRAEAATEKIGMPRRYGA